jgi:16S rRNA (adenine1518-N6/adenine1519-N6)-dimethyltransferase
MLQYYFDMEKVLDVSAVAFRPIPNVESAVVRMVPRADSRRARDERMFAETVALAFSQRRKTLRNTLGRGLTATAFDTLGIDPHARAQTLTVDQFLDIADYRSACQREEDQRQALP